MYVFIEEIFFVNFIIDACLIFSTIFVLKRKVLLLRIISAAAIGGLYAVLCINNKFLSSVVTKTVVMFLMICISDSRGSVKQYAVKNVLFLLDSAFFSGIYLLFEISGSVYSVNLSSNVLAINADYLSLSICLLMTQILFTIVIKRLLPVFIKEQLYCRGMIEMSDGKKKSINFFFDTGNKLITTSGRPVVVLSEDIFEALTSQKFYMENTYEELYGKYDTEEKINYIRAATPLGEKYIPIFSAKVTLDGYLPINDIFITGGKALKRKIGGIINPAVLERYVK